MFLTRMTSVWKSGFNNDNKDIKMEWTEVQIKYKQTLKVKVNVQKSYVCI